MFIKLPEPLTKSDKSDNITNFGEFILENI